MWGLFKKPKKKVDPLSEYNDMIKHLNYVRTFSFPFDLEKQISYSIYSSLGYVVFYSKDLYLCEKYPFLKLKQTDKWTSLGQCKYELAYELYEKYFTNNENIIHIIDWIIIQIKNDKNGKQYSFIVNKYALTVLTIFNTFQDSVELNGEISKEIFKNSTKLLQMFAKEIKNREIELEEEREVEKVTVNKSLCDRLKNEIEYVEKFVAAK